MNYLLSSPFNLPNGGQEGFYISFMEKSYAVINYNSLWCLQGGKISEALFDLTGAPTHEFNIWMGESGKRKRVNMKYFKKLEKAKKEWTKNEENLIAARKKKEEERAKKKKEKEDEGFFDKIINFFKNLGGGDDKEKSEDNEIKVNETEKFSSPRILRNSKFFFLKILARGKFAPLEPNETTEVYNQIKHALGNNFVIVAKTPGIDKNQRKMFKSGLKSNMG